MLSGHEAEPGVVLGHHVSAKPDPGTVLLPAPDSGPVQPIVCWEVRAKESGKHAAHLLLWAAEAIMQQCLESMHQGLF